MDHNDHDLDSLADQLIERELKSPPAQLDGIPDLPEYLPLSRDNPFLKAEVFNVEEFLLSRSHTSLHDLRVELRDFLSDLKEQLVKLINDDYEKFISLSTDLRGEGTRLNRIKAPLAFLQAEIQESKTELGVIQDAIEEKLRKRAKLRDEKALLHLLLKISDSVTRLESLLVINNAEQNVNGTSDMPVTLKLQTSTSEDQAEEVTRGNHAKHLSRVAAEYTQLLYHTSKAKMENCVFVDEIQWRIDRIQSTLSSDLDHLFGNTLNALTEGKPFDGKALDLEKPKLTADLSECLRTYDLLGLWRDAEDVLRKEVVRRFVKKTIFPGALAAPHSPLVPHTPFRSSSTSATFTSPAGLPPTPYTPYTSFALRTAPFQPSYPNIGKPNSPHIGLLDESDDALARMYSQILRFVERDLTRIMELAEKVSLKSFPSIRLEKGDGSTPQTSVPMQSVARGEGQRYEIMANVVWDEFGRAIMDDLGNIVFSAGRPDEFRKNHELTQSFIRGLEFYAPSKQAIETMRSHPTYINFERRWQLPVYFQLRWKEIIVRLEEALATTRIEPSGSTTEQNRFITTQAAAVWTAISACWSAEVFIPELSHRFWRLTVQLLSRYKSWLDQVLENTLKAAVAEQTSTNPTRSSSPAPGADSTNESAPSDDAILRQNVAAMVDIRAMKSSVMILWQEQISNMLPMDTDTPTTDDVNPEDALEDALTTLSSLTAPLSSQIISILSKRCRDAVTPVRSIPSTIRARSNKKPPTEPSSFIANILRPVKVFFGIGTSGVGTVLKDEFLGPCATKVFDSVCQRYVALAIGLRKSEDSLRRLTKAKRTGFSLFGAAGKEGEARDEDNIKAQMILDVEAFGKIAESLGVNLRNHETYQMLHETVHSLLDPLDAS